MIRLLSYFLVFAFFSIEGYSLNKSDGNEYQLLREFRRSIDTVTSLSYFNQLISDEFRDGLPPERDSFRVFISGSVELGRKLNDDPGLAKAYYNLGKYYISASSNYAKAIPYILQGLTLFEKIGDSTGISVCYMQIGLTSYMMQYYEDAIKNFKLSVDYRDNPTAIYLMAISYSELDKFEESKKYFSIAMKVYKEKNIDNRMNECYMYLGKLYERQGKLDSAFYYLKMSIRNIEMTIDNPNLVRPYALISGVFLKNNDIDSAIYYADKSYQRTKKSTDKISTMLSAETLSKAYEIKGEYKKANYFLNKYYSIKNKNFEGNAKQKIAEMQSKFDFNKKIHTEKLRHQTEIHDKNQTKNIILISGLFMLLLAGGLYSRLRFVRNSNAKLEKEKDRSDNLLLNILPAEIAQELKEKGKASARKYERTSILFTDFKEFTQNSEQLSPEELVEEINYCYKAFDGIMGKYGIEKIKTIGDSYMAAGGLPVPTDGSVKNTVLAGLEMQEFISNYYQERFAEGEIGFEMRVGIHTGPVVAGIVGVKKFQYDIWGDTVNTASRMESSGEVGKVNISQSTYEQLKDDTEFSFEHRGKIEAKGKGEIDMYFVERKR